VSVVVFEDELATACPYQLGRHTVPVSGDSRITDERGGTKVG